MLCLTRRPDQSIMVGTEIEIIILEVRGQYVRLGINAPRDIIVHRRELFEQGGQDNCNICDDCGRYTPRGVCDVCHPVIATDSS